ncbi:MAG TPA: YiiD C-terminal domain-containing protein [Ktedonosporobacter sp.]|nr:YiiD C-terminal domain-containing protein [Ktedonosporobacter sp.]
MDWEQALALEPFLAYVGIEAETLGPEYVTLRLRMRREISNHMPGIHAGAQFTLGETTAITASVLSVGEPLERLIVLTATATVTYQRPAQGDLVARASVQHEQREELRATMNSRGRVRLTIPIEVADSAGQVVTTLSVVCVLLPR